MWIAQTVAGFAALIAITLYVATRAELSWPLYAAIFAGGLLRTILRLNGQIANALFVLVFSAAVAAAMHHFIVVDDDSDRGFKYYAGLAIAPVLLITQSIWISRGSAPISSGYVFLIAGTTCFLLLLISRSAPIYRARLLIAGCIATGFGTWLIALGIGAIVDGASVDLNGLMAVARTHTALMFLPVFFFMSHYVRMGWIGPAFHTKIFACLASIYCIGVFAAHPELRPYIEYLPGGDRVPGLTSVALLMFPAGLSATRFLERQVS